MSLKYKNLEFFNKNGVSYNFDYDSTLEKWTGNIYFPRVSIELFESEHIFIYERILDLSSNEIYGKPHIYDFITTNTINAYWNNAYLDDKIIMYSVNSSNNIETNTNFNIDLDYSTSDSFINDYKQSDIINQEFVKINIAIKSDIEGLYEQQLIIKDLNDNHIIAEIYMYGEVIGEDERLKVLCDNLGYFINHDDELIFSESDINEEKANYILLNRKRKEILLEGSNIYPFIGSYKGLINAINYFGFDELAIKEYWKNINIESKDYGKYKQNEILEIFNSDIDFNKKLIDSQNYRKTNNIALVYQLHNVDYNSLDKYDYPLVTENFIYTFEEVLIKLYALKEKLKKEFLPFMINIKDIIGEGTYFLQKRKSSTLSISNTTFLISGVTPKIVLETTNNKIIDLRNVYELITQYDFESGFEHDIRDRLDETVEELGNYIVALFRNYYPTINKLENLPDKPNIPIGCPVVITNTTFDTVIKDLDVTLGELNSDNDYYIDFEVLTPYIGDVYTIYESVSDVTIEYEVLIAKTEDEVTEELYNLFLGVTVLPHVLFTPLIVIKDLKKYLRIFAKDISTTNIKFNFQSYVIQGDLVKVQRLNKYLISLNSNYTLANIGRINYYEIEWIITNEDNTFTYSVKGDINQYKTLFINLPLIGSYNIEVLLYNTNNIISRKVFNNFINIELNKVDFLGVYRYVNDGYDNIKSLKNIKFNEHKLISYKPLIVNDTKIKDCVISFRSLNRIGLLPNIKFEDNYLYTVQTYQPNQEISFPGPFTFKSIGSKIQMKDLAHVTNKMTVISGDTPASFDVLDINIGGRLKILDLISDESGTHLFETNDLKTAVDNLNNSTDKIISKYIYNYVDNDEGYFTETDKQSFIHVVGKYNGFNCDWERIEFQNITLDNIEPSRTFGYKINDFKILHDFRIFEGVVYIQFSADNCAISGKKRFVWTVNNISIENWKPIEFYTKNFGYLFHMKGKYNISLLIEDGNGNIGTISKNLIIIK